VTKWVYFFGAGKAEGDGSWRDLLGGKGAGLAEMTKIGCPCPPVLRFQPKPGLLLQEWEEVSGGAKKQLPNTSRASRK